MKTILVPVVALVLGLVAGTAWTVVVHEPPPAVADSTAVDSAGSEVLAADPADDPAAEPTQAAAVVSNWRRKARQKDSALLKPT